MINKKSTILYISDIFGNKSGAPKSAKDVLINLLATNLPVKVLSNSNKIKLPIKLLENTINKPEWIKAPRKIPFPKQINSGFPRNIAKWTIRSCQDILRQNYMRKIKNINPDLIFVNSIGSHALYSNCNYSKENKSIMIFRGSPNFFKSPANPFFNLEYAKNALSQYFAIIFVSSIVRDKWLSFKTLANKKTFYIPNCCEEDRVQFLLDQNRSAVRNQLGISLDKFIMVCVATIQHKKGQDLLVNNFDKIKKISPNICLYLIGTISSSWGKNLVRQIKIKKFGNRMKVMGNRSNALSYIYAADLLILPSRAEAMPRVILEAMALKTPVIASNVDGIPELIEHDKSGLLFPSENSEKMLVAIERFYNNYEERKKFANIANEKYWANFSRAIQMKRYANVIDEML